MRGVSLLQQKWSHLSIEGLMVIMSKTVSLAVLRTIIYYKTLLENLQVTFSDTSGRAENGG